MVVKLWTQTQANLQSVQLRYHAHRLYHIDLNNFNSKLMSLLDNTMRSKFALLMCRTPDYDSPQAGLGEPTWPDKLSLASIELIIQEVSVIPYPSITWPPKQLWRNRSMLLSSKLGKDWTKIYIFSKLIIHDFFWACNMQTMGKTYILRKSMTSGDRGEAPDPMKRTRPPSLSFILLNTNLSHMGEGFFPET